MTKYQFIDIVIKEYSKFKNKSQDEITAHAENFTREINNDVVVEYINGCARVFTINNNITECIISYCNLNYE